MEKLKKLPQWIVWALEIRNGKPTKILYDPKSGSPAKTNDPKTWGTFEQAWKLYNERINKSTGEKMYNGVGFVFTEQDNFFGIDIDHYNPGEKPEIDQILVKFAKTYIERSQSGKGVHIIGIGKLPGDKHKSVKSPLGEQVEFYDKLRYFAITFDCISEGQEVVDCQKELTELYNYNFPKKTEKVERYLPIKSTVLSDQEIIDKALASSNATTFRKLYYDGCFENEDHSACDLALLNLLAFWCGNDKAQIDRLFRGSALMREKWERADYRNSSIQKAIDDCTSFYEPQKELDLDYIKYDQRAVEEAFSSTEEEFDKKQIADELRALKDKERNKISVISMVLNSDPELQGIIINDIFAQEYKIHRRPPWSSEERKGESWSDTDFSGLCQYLEYYGITKETNIKHAFNLFADRHKYHPVRAYLKPLKWDGVPRLDSMFINYLGAEDNEFNRAITRKIFVAAVARVMEPGVKFDHMLVIKGLQGIGKTLILTLLGFTKWHNGNIKEFTGKEPVEQLIGSWIIEIEELSAIRRSDELSAKSFLTKQVDKVRLAYARNTISIPRQCVFFGTTNEDTFLKDITGNRRFWIMNCPNLAKIKVWDEERGITTIRDQIWAEAKYRYEQGEKLILPEHLEKIARELQTKHTTPNEFANYIDAYLEKKVPYEWETMPISRRIEYIANYTENSAGVKTIDKVTPEMIWQEALGGAPSRFTKKETMTINSYMRTLPNWKEGRVSTVYGSRQSGFIRISEN